MILATLFGLGVSIVVGVGAGYVIATREANRFDRLLGEMRDRQRRDIENHIKARIWEGE